MSALERGEPETDSSLGAYCCDSSAEGQDPEWPSGRTPVGLLLTKVIFVMSSDPRDPLWAEESLLSCETGFKMQKFQELITSSQNGVQGRSRSPCGVSTGA